MNIKVRVIFVKEKKLFFKNYLFPVKDEQRLNNFYCKEKNCNLNNKLDKQQSICKLQISSVGYLQKIPDFETSNYIMCLNSKCSAGEYKCQFYKYCIAIQLVCDGIKHCLLGDDETDCRMMIFFFLFIKQRRSV